MCLKNIFWISLWGGLALTAGAQTTRIHQATIKTVTTTGSVHTQDAVPVVRLGGDEKINVAFDHLGHEAQRYVYTLRHLNAAWEDKENLLPTDYMRSIDGECLIDEGELSMTTATLYTHYSFQLPNAEMAPIISGNYAIDVYDDSGDERTLAFTTYFCVTEEKATIVPKATTDTDRGRNTTKQQIEASAVFGSSLSPRTANELMLTVVKNGDMAHAATLVSPYALAPGSAQWQHQDALIFDAGNEYRKYELQSTRYPGMHVESIRLNDDVYHATLSTDECRKNYLYDEDQNGVYQPAISGNGNADTDADYVWFHFSLYAPDLSDDTRIWVDGRWAAQIAPDERRLTYDAATGCFTAHLLLKGGYYSYRYATESEATNPIENNFWQTENTYTFFLYYRERGARYDRLIGSRTSSYRPR